MYSLKSGSLLVCQHASVGTAGQQIEVQDRFAPKIIPAMHWITNVDVPNMLSTGEGIEWKCRGGPNSLLTLHRWGDDRNAVLARWHFLKVKGPKEQLLSDTVGCCSWCYMEHRGRLINFPLQYNEPDLLCTFQTVSATLSSSTFILPVVFSAWRSCPVQGEGHSFDFLLCWRKTLLLLPFFGVIFYYWLLSMELRTIF